MTCHAEIIASSTGLQITHLPIQYLGVPLYKGRAKMEYFFDLIAKFEKRISGWRGRLLSFGGKITLIKSVLNALPIHALSIIKPPKKLIQHLEKSMAAFLWNSKERHRKRWVSWSQICRPLAEGGLGIRSLDQVMTALHAKRCWSVILGESAWAQYMVRKYGDPTEDNYSMPYQPSQLWRAMVKIFPVVYNLCTWVVGRGLIPIWGSNWCGTILPKPHIFDYTPNIRQVVDSPIIRTAVGTYVDIRQYLPNVAKRVLRSMVLNEEKDKICWILTQNGEFSTTSFWDNQRQRHPIDRWSIFYWNKFIQPRVGAFLWRLSRNAIPVDARLISMGFKMASRCTCCVNPKVETLSHLFLSGETASRTWQHFSDIFQVQSQATDIDQLAQVWLNKISLSSPSDICRNIIFGNVLWELWKQRNEIIFGGGKRNNKLIISRVSATLLQHIEAHNIISDEGDKIRRAYFSADLQSGTEATAAIALSQHVAADAAAQLSVESRGRPEPGDHSIDGRETAPLQGSDAAAAQHNWGRPGADTAGRSSSLMHAAANSQLDPAAAAS